MTSINGSSSCTTSHFHTTPLLEELEPVTKASRFQRKKIFGGITADRSLARVSSLMWMAGGGTRGGMAHGATDDFGRDAMGSPVRVDDLHATILHLRGLDHERLTSHYGGRDARRTSPLELWTRNSQSTPKDFRNHEWMVAGEATRIPADAAGSLFGECHLPIQNLLKTRSSMSSV